MSVNTVAITRIAPRSSTTASVSRNARSDAGSDAADDGQHSQSERDVGGHRHCPAVQAPVADSVDHEVDARRDDHAASAAATGTRASAGLPRLPTVELALELEPGDEEEDGETTVGCPVLERQRPELEMDEGRVGISQGEFAQTRAMTPVANRSAPPTVSWRSMSATTLASCAPGADHTCRRRGVAGGCGGLGGGTVPSHVPLTRQVWSVDPSILVY